MPPKVLQKNPDRGGGSGVLPIPASARAPPAPKPPAARLKLEIRRLPPGLTLSEFEETLGDEWKLGKGRVDWREYRQGKAKNVSKMPELSRCYVHLAKEEFVRDFEARFLAVAFRDKAGSWKNGAGGAPMLGFAMNQRVPLQQGKQRARADNRQGTIDQDAEYMAFLEAETQPIPKASAIDSAGAEKKEEEEEGGKAKVKSTPLIEDLRERKANKAKVAASKAEKADRKGKGDSKGEDSTPAASSGGKKGDKGKTEQAAKEVAKAANKQASGKQGQNKSAANGNANANATSQKAAQTSAKGRRGAAQQNAKAEAAAAAAAAAAKPQPQQQTNTPAGPAAQRGQRQRGNNTEGIKKMLQKDLGIKPKAAAADSPAQTGNAATGRNANNNQQTPVQPKNAAQTHKQQQQQQSSNSGGLYKAYLKHANPSQGMTEILIQQALAQFGEMNNVTIDPRKGTAIAVFKTQDGLKKAVQAKKVPVAKGAVEVIEFKDRGGGGGNNSNNNNNNNNNNNQNNNNNNSGNAGNGGGGSGGGGGGRGGFRNRGGRSGRGGNNNSGTSNANVGKGGEKAAAAAPAAG